ncbi:MAG: alanyl-tRNA editing protein, partial [Bullifex sp.]
MTEMYYYTEPYRKVLPATVTSVSPKGLYLDRTISYPEGGGQPGDRGMINGIPYGDTQHEGDEIIHVMKDTSSFRPGDSVTLELDWAHRYDYMQQHTAQHLLSGLMYKNHGIGTLSVHQGEDILTVETDRSEISEEVLLMLEDEANRAINEGHAVYYREMSHEEAEGLGLRRSIKVDGDVRLVYIDGVDVIACGGIHVASTSEIGELSYAGSEMIRGHVRTVWRTGDRAKAKRRRDASLAKSLCALLSSQEDRILSSAEKLADEN